MSGKEEKRKTEHGWRVGAKQKKYLKEWGRRSRKCG